MAVRSCITPDIEYHRSSLPITYVLPLVPMSQAMTQRFRRSSGKPAALGFPTFGVSMLGGLLRRSNSSCNEPSWVPFGEVPAGDVPAGEVPAGEVPFGEALLLGVPAGLFGASGVSVNSALDGPPLSSSSRANVLGIVVGLNNGEGVSGTDEGAPLRPSPNGGGEAACVDGGGEAACVRYGWAANWGVRWKGLATTAIVDGTVDFRARCWRVGSPCVLAFLFFPAMAFVCRVTVKVESPLSSFW